MSNTIIQIKRSQTTIEPASLQEGELAYSGNSQSNALFIGLPDGANTITKIGGGKYAFLDNADTGNATHAVVEGGTLTANAVMITDANSSIDEIRTAKLVINTSGTTTNPISSVSVFANTSQLGANAGGSNTELVTSSAIKTYVDGKTAAIGGALANQQIAFSNGSVFQGSGSFTYDYDAETLNLANTLAIGANVTLDYEALNVGGTVVNGSTVSTTDVAAANVDATVAVTVGSNVSLSTSQLSVGNSTVNTTITATAITTDGTLHVTDTATFSNGVAMSNTKITGLATPTAADDAATKAYVDEAAQGLVTKPSVELATTGALSATYYSANGSLVADSNGAFPTIDGVTLANTTPGHNGVLVKDQANAAHNGRYNLTQVGNTGAPWILSRCSLCDDSSEIPGMYVFVQGGTLYQGTGWVATVADAQSFTIDTDDVTFIQFSGAGTYSAGDYLYVDGTEFNVNASSSSVASVVVARDADENFAANVVTVNSIVAGNGQFSGPITGVTTLESGNTTITGFINVSSTAAIAGALTVTNTAALGNTTVTGFANVSGDVAVGGDLTVSGNTELGVVSLGNTTIDGFANVTGTLAAGDSTITGYINVSSTADIAGALTVTNTAAVGNTTVTGFINVSSSATVAGPLSVTNTAGLGNTTITGFANVSGDLEVGGDLHVTGNTNFGTVSLGNTTITGYANVSTTLAAGNTTVTGFINVSSDATVGGDLSVTGNTTLGSDSSDEVVINGQLASDIVPQANATYDLGSSALRFNNVYSAHVHSTTGSFQDVTISGNLTVSGTLTSIDTDNIVVEDSLIKLARNNTTTDALDIGLYGSYGDSGAKYSGLFRDQSDSGVWKLFTGLTVDPTTTVDTSNASFQIATLEAYLKSGALVSNTTAVTITANSTVAVNITANSITTGAITLPGLSGQDILVANSSGGLQALSLGTAGKVLQSNGSALIYEHLDGGSF